MTEQPRTLPTRRTHVFDPPAGLAQARQTEPVCPVRMPDGVPGWLVTGHAESQQVLADPRFSARQDLRRMPADHPAPPPAAPGFFVRMDGPEHARYRREVTRHLTRRRLRSLVPLITAVTDRHLDALEDGGPPADLVASFGMPVPSLVVGGLLGIGASELEQFQRDSRTLVDLRSAPEQVAEAMSAVRELIRRTVTAAAAQPDEGLLSALLQGGLSAEEVVGVGVLLLVAGHETTANMATLAVFALLCHRTELAAARAALTAAGDDDHDQRAVDELLRYLTVNQFGALRVPLTEVELAGRTLAPGDPVVVSLAAANRDPQCFEEPDRLRVERRANPHLAFGHGAHLCSGHQLARLELQIMLGRLLRRFPGLRLAVPPQQVPLRLGSSVYGVARLPVTW